MKKILLLWALTLPLVLRAQQEFLVADGSSSGTYQVFLKQMVEGISDPSILFKEIPSSGAVENLDKLVNNEVMGAFMHSDVLYHRSKQDGTINTKFATLLALFNEDVHFIVLSTPKKVAGGFLGYGSKPIVYENVGKLTQNTKVGAAGGGVITASLISSEANLHYEVVSFNSGKEVLQALADGTIEVAVFTGAAPLPNLVNLDSTVRLLEFPNDISDRLHNLYRPTTVTYVKMSPQPIHTIAAQCLFVSKRYKSPRYVDVLSNFRLSFFKNLDTIKETPGNHKKWQDVSSDDHGVCGVWMDLPCDAAIATTAASASK